MAGPFWAKNKTKKATQHDRKNTKQHPGATAGKTGRPKKHAKTKRIRPKLEAANTSRSYLYV